MVISSAMNTERVSRFVIRVVHVLRFVIRVVHVSETYDNVSWFDLELFCNSCLFLSIYFFNEI